MRELNADVVEGQRAATRLVEREVFDADEPTERRDESLGEIHGLSSIESDSCTTSPDATVEPLRRCPSVTLNYGIVGGAETGVNDISFSLAQPNLDGNYAVEPRPTPATSVAAVTVGLEQPTTSATMARRRDISKNCLKVSHPVPHRPATGRGLFRARSGILVQCRVDGQRQRKVKKPKSQKVQ